MARFFAKPLGVLDRIYEFIGGENISSYFDVGGSLTPVHDVSREAERGAGRYYNVTETVTNVGASTTTANIVLGTATDAEADEDVWVIGSSADMDVGGNFTNCAVALEHGIVTELGISNQLQLLLYRTNAINLGTRFVARPVVADGSEYEQLAIKVEDPAGASILYRVESSGNLSLDINLFLWIGPKGATPPGMA